MPRRYRTLFAKDLDAAGLARLGTAWRLRPSGDPADPRARLIGIAEATVAGLPVSWEMRRIGPGVAWCVEPKSGPILLAGLFGRTRKLDLHPNSANDVSTMRWTVDHSSREPLQHQIAGCVRHGVASGELTVGEQLPPAAELAAALSVDRNTVLAAYRQLRDEGLLEFRRGRGTRVSSAGAQLASVTEAAQALIAVARAQGLGRTELIRLIEELT